MLICCMKKLGSSAGIHGVAMPRYPGARALTALRRQSSRQLVTEPSLKAKHPAPAGQRGFWRPLRAARKERAAPRSQTSEEPHWTKLVILAPWTSHCARVTQYSDWPGLGHVATWRQGYLNLTDGKITSSEHWESVTRRRGVDAWNGGPRHP